MVDASHLKYIALLLLVVQTTSAVILTRYSKLRPSDGPRYISTTLVVMQEATKMVLSMILVYVYDIPAAGAGGDGGASAPSGGGGSKLSRWSRLMYSENFERPVDTLKLAVPAALYTLQNNLVYVALANLESTTFQVGYQSKVITTAVLSVLMLGRSLSYAKWTALFALMFGIVLTQISGSSEAAAEGSTDVVVGLASVVTSSFSSAFAGVYFEKILKGTQASVWMRNTQLAFFSVVLGLGGMILKDGLFIDFFQGYDFLVFCIIMTQAVGGLIVAVVIKYADNILKGFATALSILLCGWLSSTLFGFVPGDMFVVGGIIVVMSTMLYSLPDSAFDAWFKSRQNVSGASSGTASSPGGAAARAV